MTCRDRIKQKMRQEKLFSMISESTSSCDYVSLFFQTKNYDQKLSELIILIVWMFSISWRWNNLRYGNFTKNMMCFGYHSFKTQDISISIISEIFFISLLITITYTHLISPIVHFVSPVLFPFIFWNNLNITKFSPAHIRRSECLVCLLSRKDTLLQEYNAATQVRKLVLRYNRNK